MSGDSAENDYTSDEALGLRVADCGCCVVVDMVALNALGAEYVRLRREVDQRVQTAREVAYRDASGEVHKEARWTHEQTMRGTPPDPLDRLLVVEKVLLDRADGLNYPPGENA